MRCHLQSFIEFDTKSEVYDTQWQSNTLAIVSCISPLTITLVLKNGLMLKKNI